MAVQNKQLTLGKISFTLLYILSFPALLLWLGGDWHWVEGWIFSFWFTLLCTTVIIYLYRTDPALLTERYQKPGTANQKGWDRYVVYGLLIGFILWIVIIPLDAKRFRFTSHFLTGFKILGGTGLIVSFFFFFRSYMDNTFLSPLIRVQTERNHRVVSTGVYAMVRHPMYLGASLLFTGAPMLLGSFYGLTIGVILIFLLAGRIIGEEKMLADELEGYADYQKKVKYRLIPFIW